MLKVRVPLRANLAGAIDLPDIVSQFPDDEEGFMCTAALDLHVYIDVQYLLFDPSVIVKTRTPELVENIDQLSDDKNPEIKAALKSVDIRSNIEIAFMGNVPRGTGLGASGAYLVGLLLALYRLKGKYLSPKELAEAAAEIEIKKLGRPIGQHDHHITAIGGVVFLHIAKDGSVRVEEANFSQDTLMGFQEHATLFLTDINKKHLSGEILGAQKRAAESGDRTVVDIYRKMRDLGCLWVAALRANDFVRCGKLMDEHWRLKRLLPGGVSSKYLDFLYDEARRNRALGGKVLGSGGAGFFIFMVAPENRNQLRDAMCGFGLKERPFNFEFRGATLNTDWAEPHELFPFRDTKIRRLVFFDSDLVS